MKIDECIKIYKEDFGSREPFDTILFESFGDCLHTVKQDGKTVSMLFTLPCELNFEDKKQKLYYVYAAATDSEYRGMGYMSALIKDVAKDSNAPLFLKPATESLGDFYQKLGFKKINATTEKCGAFIEISEKHKRLSELCDSRHENYILMVNGDLTYDIKELSFRHTLD